MELMSATKEHIDSVMDLQRKYHVDSINESEKQNGFVTTLFSREQLEGLVERENGLSIAVENERVVAYAMAASWQYWSPWPLFEYMISQLSSIKYNGIVLDTENCYQYGPVCLDGSLRGTGLLEKIFRHSMETVGKRYEVLVTFINALNHRSFVAHTKKLGLETLKTFRFNSNDYYWLACPAGKPGGFE